MQPGYRTVPAAITLALLTVAAPVAGQAGNLHSETFDPDRALLNDAPWFEPFRPTSLEALEDALKDGRVTDETAVLVLERGDNHLSLLTMQMSYHHVAQGDLAGEPWMVSF